MGANSISIQQDGAVGSASGIKTADGTVLAANPKRIWFAVVNLNTTVALVKLGASASTSDFHYPLQAGAATDDGKGGAYFDSSYKGIVSVKAASGSPRVSVIELEANY